MTRLVTLLVPNYNGSRFLPEILPRLLAQTFTDFEILVVDNCSTDGSVEVVRRFADPRLRLVEAAEHVPILPNFNRAIALVQTPFFATCAVDEVYEPGWLEVIMGLHDRQPDAFFACCKANSADDAGKVYCAGPERYKASFWPANEPCVFDARRYVSALMRGSFFICTTGVFRTSATDQIGPLDESRPFVSDWQYYVRGLLAGFTIIGTHEPLVHYRRHAGMLTRVFAADLSRFHQELEMIEWIAQAGHEQGMLESAQPDYRLVRNTVMSELAGRLARGDRQGADQLLAFAREKIPGFRGSVYDHLLDTSRRFGKYGGQALQLCESAFLRLLSPLR